MALRGLGFGSPKPSSRAAARHRVIGLIGAKRAPVAPCASRPERTELKPIPLPRVVTQKRGS